MQSGGLCASTSRTPGCQAISAVTLRGSCVLKFEFKDPVTQQQMHYEFKQEAGR